ncbi:MAG: ABC transporter ATP-binding protein [Bdellovibrionales bacterium]|nr:ABC transporter ATP-binding protein [Bdellovibrionales bacterium]
MSQVTLSALKKSYGATVVVPGLDLEVRDGEFLSLLGPSGCGKTTVLRMVAGLETPSGGNISLGDSLIFSAEKGINVPPERRNLGMVFQSYAVWPHMTVLQNVCFPLKVRGIKKEEQQRRAEKVLASVQLGHLSYRKPNQLSGGQQQRVALARALVAEPSVLLLDEPLSNLDAVLRDEMCEIILELRKKYAYTMLYVTHDQKEAFRMSDRIALLDKGELVQSGSPQEIRENPKTEFVSRFIRG